MFLSHKSIRVRFKRSTPYPTSPNKIWWTDLWVASFFAPSLTYRFSHGWHIRDSRENKGQEKEKIENCQSHFWSKQNWLQLTALLMAYNSKCILSRKLSNHMLYSIRYLVSSSIPPPTPAVVRPSCSHWHHRVGKLIWLEQSLQIMTLIDGCWKMLNKVERADDKKQYKLGKMRQILPLVLSHDLPLCM